MFVDKAIATFHLLLLLHRNGGAILQTVKKGVITSGR